ncbi:hypothetical protein Taro_010154 [Colocasia esculenta]|uniref:Putative plant transposon protein domain-containing protein n=1 Tax=Colocasia esculenta TaxID=4460 RepID=A0A843TY65_COLES|nr:hypothetical protein [Colocasia esculenta]
MQWMKWSQIATISEASYPYLVKAFYVCLRSEADGSLISTVKGTQIHITYDLLESLFGVSTTGHNGVDCVDVQAKGLGIIGSEFKLKDDKIDTNQLNAFNQIHHFIVCQILVPRSATFPSCTKTNSDMMFWAIHNQDINMAEVIIKRMKSASVVIWDKKNKLKVSLPYAHLLTKIFQHFNINLTGEVSEKMGQAIRGRNLKKSGFSLVPGVWTKTSVVESEAIIGEGPEAPQVQESEVEAEVQVRSEAPVMTTQEEVEKKISVGQAQQEDVQVPTIPDVQSHQEEVRTEFPVVQQEEADIQIEVPVGNPQTIEEIPLRILSLLGNLRLMPPPLLWHLYLEVCWTLSPALKGSKRLFKLKKLPFTGSKSYLMEDAPIEGEHAVEKEVEAQGEHTYGAPDDQFREGVVESTSDEENEEFMEPAARASDKGKDAAPNIPLLIRREHHSSKKKKLKVNMKLVIERLDTHREILWSLQNELGQFRQALSTLGSGNAHTSSIQVDFATLEIPDVVFLNPLHSLVMESAVGTMIFERFAMVMGRISVQKGGSVSFHIFVFREYHQGHIRSDVLAPLLSECEHLSPSEWEQLYPLIAQQLTALNVSQARSGQPPLPAAEFLDLNSIHLVRDPYETRVERYKVYMAMKKELKQHQIFYPITIDKFLQHASFSTSTFYKSSLGSNEYGSFIEAQRQLHIQRMVLVMGPSHSIVYGAFESLHNFVTVVSTQVQCVSTHALYPGSSDEEKLSVMSTLLESVSTQQLYPVNRLKKSSQWCRHSLPRQASPYNTQKSFLAAKGVFPDLVPSPEAADHPFKRKDVGIKAILWREV